MKTSHRDVFKRNLLRIATRGSGLVRFPSKKLSLFLTPFSVRRKYGAGDFALCGERPGTLSLDPGSIFEKLLHQKAFISV